MALLGTASVSRKLAMMKIPEPRPGETPRTLAAETYLKALGRLLLYVAAFPILVLGLGIAGNIPPLVTLVGIFWAIATVGLLAVASPLGILIEVLVGGVKGSGERYVKAGLLLLLTELTFTLFVAVFPIKRNPLAIPILIVAAAILAVLAALGTKTPFTKKVIGAFATTQFILFTLSLVFPQSFLALGTLKDKIDKGVGGILTRELRTQKQLPSPTYPICPGAEGLPIILGQERNNREAKLRLEPHCLSREVLAKDEVGVALSVEPGNWYEYHFVDGTVVRFRKDEKFNFARPRYPRFRLRGTGLARLEAKLWGEPDEPGEKWNVP